MLTWRMPAASIRDLRSVKWKEVMLCPRLCSRRASANSGDTCPTPEYEKQPMFAIAVVYHPRLLWPTEVQTSFRRGLGTHRCCHLCFGNGYSHQKPASDDSLMPNVTRRHSQFIPTLPIYGRKRGCAARRRRASRALSPMTHLN
jgi:hypothetical protein